MLERGDLVLLPFPFAELSSTKVRPALVLSSAAYHRGGSLTVVCGLTSNLSASAYSVLVNPTDLSTGRLAAPSRIKVDRIATIDQRLIRKRIGRVKAQVLAQVAKELSVLLPVAP